MIKHDGVTGDHVAHLLRQFFAERIHTLIFCLQLFRLLLFLKQPLLHLLALLLLCLELLCQLCGYCKLLLLQLIAYLFNLLASLIKQFLPQRFPLLLGNHSLLLDYPSLLLEKLLGMLFLQQVYA